MIAHRTLTYAEILKQGRKRQKTFFELYLQVLPHLKDPIETTIGVNLLNRTNVELHRSHRRTTHTHVIGASRFGKSNFLMGQILQDIENSEAGLCLIDPHGSLYDDIVSHLACEYPETFAKRVILFEPANPLLNCIGFNPIPTLQDITNISYVAECITHAFFLVWGHDPNEYPRILNWLQNLCYLVVRFQKKLTDIYTFLYHGDAREQVLNMLDSNDENEDMILSDLLEFHNLSPTRQNEYKEGVKNRIKPFISNRRIKEVLNSNSGIDFQDAMENKKIILMNLNGEQGDLFQMEQTRLLGSLIINEIVRVGKKREPEESKQSPFYVYIDEVGEMPSTILAEALTGLAKRSILFTLAHQNLSQIKVKDKNGEPKFYDAVLGNCQNKIVFGGLHWRDAEEMALEMPELITLDKHKEYVYELATLPYEDWTPKEQTIFESVETSKQDHSQKISFNAQHTQNIQLSEQNTLTFQTQTSTSRSQAQEIAEILTRSQEFSSRESLMEALAYIRSKSHTNTLTNSELNQIATILGSRTMETETDQKRESIANIVSQANTRTNEHIEGEMLATIATEMNSCETRETLTETVQDLIDKSESEMKTKGKSAATTDSEGQSNETFRSETQEQRDEEAYTVKQGQSSEDTRSNSSMNERGRGWSNESFDGGTRRRCPFGECAC